MKVEEIMVQKVVTVKADATVKVAVRLMNQHEIGCLIALESSEAVGIITERDLLRKVLEESKDPAKIKVREIMSKKLIVGVPTMEIIDAVRLMLKNGVKKLPIVVDRRLVGLITLTDIARAARIRAQMDKSTDRQERLINKQAQALAKKDAEIKALKARLRAHIANTS